MDREDWEDILEELLSDDSDTMTAWEVEFIKSLDKQRQAPEFDLSGRQWATLCKVWQKVFE